MEKLLKCSLSLRIQQDNYFFCFIRGTSLFLNTRKIISMIEFLDAL